VYWSPNILERREQVAQFVATVWRSCSAASLKTKTSGWSG
jgi:hypothetical protein